MPMRSLATGFVFHWQEAQAIAGTLNWVLDVYAQNPAAWRRMQERGMKSDFSWGKSALEYIDLYESAVAKARAKSE